MSILLNLVSTQIDYTATVVHAPIDCLVYVEYPKMFCCGREMLKVEEVPLWFSTKSLKLLPLHQRETYQDGILLV